MKKKITSIQLIRVIAIILVIGCHVCLPPILETGRIDLGRLTIACLLGDGVALFFIISGFFMFKDTDFKSKLKSTFKKIIIPTSILIVVGLLISDWVNSQSSIIRSIIDYRANYDRLHNALVSILNFNSIKLGYLQHLWYIFTYLGCLLLSPLIAYLFIDNDNNRFIKKIYYVLAVANLIFVSLTHFNMCSIISFTIVNEAMLYMMIGKEIYDRSDKIINNKKVRIISLITCIVANIVRVVLQYQLYSLNVADAYFLMWNSSISFICSISFVIFIYSFDMKNNKIIEYIGNDTFYIYLIHFVVLRKLLTNTFTTKIFEKLNVSSGSFINEVLYDAVIFIVLFIITYLVIFIIKIINKIIERVKEYVTKNKK